MNNIEIALEETMYEMIFQKQIIRFVVRLTGE